MNVIYILIIIIIISLIISSMKVSIISNNDLYSKYLKGKNIIIVGPADYVNNGELIDNYDVIVRVNRGHNMIKNPQKFGGRTDILYHCVSQDHESGGKIPEDKNIKFIKFVFPMKKCQFWNPESNKLFNNINIKNNMLTVEHKKYLDFENKLNTRPNAGTTAIWDILNYDIKSLHITGFTLFQSNYSKLYRDKTYGHSVNTGDAALKAMRRTGNHNQKSMAEYYLDDVITDKRVTYDKEFLDGINKTLSN